MLWFFLTFVCQVNLQFDLKADNSFYFCGFQSHCVCAAAFCLSEIFVNDTCVLSYSFPWREPNEFVFKKMKGKERKQVWWKECLGCGVRGGRWDKSCLDILAMVVIILKKRRQHFSAYSENMFVFCVFSERKLVTWLRLLFRTQTLIDQYYQDWSYVARTGQYMDRYLYSAVCITQA